RDRGTAVVADGATAHPHAPITVALDDVVGTDGAHAHQAADGASALGTHAGTFLDVDAADQVRIDVGAAGNTGIAAIDGGFLAGTVHQHRHAALALHAADVHIQSTAVA